MGTKKTLNARTLFDIALGVAASATATTAATAQTAPNWTGFYIGAHGGYRWADAQVTSSPYIFAGAGDIHPLPGVNGSFDPKGWIGGTHFGYNHQWAPNFLVGIEGDIDFGNATQKFSGNTFGVDEDNDGFAFSTSAQVKLGWQGTIRGRLGYVANNWLWYTTAGVAFAKVKWTSSWALVGDDFAGSNTVSGEKTLTGWVVGAGVETMFAPNWTFRTEYLLEKFGDFAVPQGIGQTGTLELDTIHKFRVGVSFKN